MLTQQATGCKSLSVTIWCLVHRVLCWHDGEILTYTSLQAIRLGFSNTFDFIGRATRSEFWWFTLFFVLAYIVVAVLDHFAATPVVDLKDFVAADYIPMAYVDPNVGLLMLMHRPLMAIPHYL